MKTEEENYLNFSFARGTNGRNNRKGTEIKF